MDRQPKLVIIYDPSGMTGVHPEQFRTQGMLTAEMTLKNGLRHRDVYEIARRLAELMLEQSQE